MATKTWLSIPVDPLINSSKESPITNSNKLVNQRLKENLPVHNWGLGTNPFPPPQELTHALELNSKNNNYSETEGLQELKESIAKLYLTNTVHVHNSKSINNAKNIVIGNGLKQLIFDLQRAFDGEIVHISPCWFTYTSQAKLLNKKITNIHTHEENDFKVTPFAIEKIGRKNPTNKKMLLFNNPTNPTGCTYTKKELLELSKVLKKYQFIVFSDEVYLGNQFSGTPLSIANFLPEHTIKGGSLSKEFSAGGYRIGWAFFPEQLTPLKNALHTLAVNSYSCAPTPQQYAVTTLLNNKQALINYRKKMLFCLKYLNQECCKEFKKLHLFFPKPQAAWYFFLSFEFYKTKLNHQNIITSEQLSHTILKETGLLFFPGSSFGLPPNQLYLRASCINFCGKEAFIAWDNYNQGIDSSFSKKWMKKIIGNIQILKNWLFSLPL